MIVLLTFVLAPLLAALLFLPSIRLAGRTAGWYIRQQTSQRRALLLDRARMEDEAYLREQQERAGVEDEGWEKIDGLRTGSATNGGKMTSEWKGVIGFFHPFCNAGGGGERVLWAAIRATQRRWPEALCVVYTGDQNVDKDEMLKKVQTRFNINLHPPTVQFLYLSTRYYVLASTYPHFTLLGQSLGSLVLALNAFALLVPDVLFDTMGYAFALGLSKFLFPDVPTGAYVHYPTISTDMLESLGADSTEGKGVNAGLGKGFRGQAKRTYWELFAKLYGRFGSDIDVVMTNSSWTQDHISKIWGPARARKGGNRSDITVVFPPCAVEEMQNAIEVSASSEKQRERCLLYIAQFRPEKNHSLVIEAFAELIRSKTSAATEEGRPRLILVGSVRDSDDATRVYKLRLLARELQVKDEVEFHCDATYPQVLDWLRRASIGVNGMWNEHFGIGVVEYQAAGLISVVNDSGGPKMDIVVDMKDGRTGFHASTTSEYAAAFAKALDLNPEQTLAMRKRARESAKRFTEDAFTSKWTEQAEKAIAMIK